MKTPHNVKSRTASKEKEREYAEQNFRNMIWFYRKELLKVQDGKKFDQLGLSQGEVGNLRRQGILRLTYTVKERIDLVGKYCNGKGRFFVLTEKARLSLKEMAVSEN